MSVGKGRIEGMEARHGKKTRLKTKLIFPCQYCQMHRSDLSKYARHIDDTHLGIIYICNACNKTYNGTWIWLKHNIEDHASECTCTSYVTGASYVPQFNWELSRRFCPDCGKEMSSLGELYHHYQEFHKGRIFVCEDCKEEFTSHTVLPFHSLNSHEGRAIFKVRYPNREIEKFVCKICNEVIKKGFDEHHAQHHGETSYICINCGFFALNTKERSRHKAHHEDCWEFVGVFNSNKSTHTPRSIDLAPTSPPSSAEGRMLLTFFTERESIDVSDIFQAETEDTTDENPDNAETDNGKDRCRMFPTSFLTLPCTSDSTNTSTPSPSTSSRDTPINPDPSSPSAIGSSDTIILASSYPTASSTASTTAIDNNPDSTLPSANDPSTSSSTSSDNQLETLTMIKSKRNFSSPRPEDGDGLDIPRKIAFMLKKWHRWRTAQQTCSNRKITNRPTFSNISFPPYKRYSNLSTSAHNQVETNFSTSRSADRVSRKPACKLENGKNRISTNYHHKLSCLGFDRKISFPARIRNLSIRPPSSGQASRVQISKSQSSTEIPNHDSTINLMDLKMEVEVETKPAAPFAAVNETFNDVKENQYFGDIRQQYVPVKESSNDITASSAATSATATPSSPDRKDSRLLSQLKSRVPRVSLERLDLHVNAIVKIGNQERLSSQSVPSSSSFVSDGQQDQRIALTHSLKQELQKLNSIGDEMQYANKTNTNKTNTNSASTHINNNISTKNLKKETDHLNGIYDNTNNMNNTEPNDTIKLTINSSDRITSYIEEVDRVRNNINNHVRNNINIKEEPYDDGSCASSSVISSNRNNSSFTDSINSDLNNHTRNSSSINNARTNVTATNIGEIKKGNVQVNHSNRNKLNKNNNHKNCNNHNFNNVMTAKKKNDTVELHINGPKSNGDFSDFSFGAKANIPLKEPSGPLENAKTWSSDSRPSSSSSSTSPNTGFCSPRVDVESTRINCCICFQAFPINLDSYRLHLVDHMKDYEGKSICPLCFVDCTEYDRMVDHFLMVHGKVRKLVCSHPTCVKSFKTRKDLDFHVRTHQAS